MIRDLLSKLLWQLYDSQYEASIVQKRQGLKSYCSLLWTHLCIQPEGRLRPCCRFEGDFSQGEDEDLIQSFQSGEKYKKLRQMSLAGHPITGCQKCYQEEAHGQESYRTSSNEQFPVVEELGVESNFSNIQHIEFFMGSQCNLKCLICHPRNSTKWEDDYKKLGWNYRKPLRHDQRLPWHDFKNLHSVKFLGGEPFLFVNHIKTLEQIPKQVRRRVSLHYFSNATRLPPSDVIGIWNDFKTVKVSLSIDAFGDLNDYIRFPSRWRNIERTTEDFFGLQKSLHHLLLNLHTTVSLYNFLDLNKVVTWFKSLNQKHKTDNQCRLTIIRDPSFLSPLNLPKSVFESAYDNWDCHQPEVRTFLKWTRKLEKLDQLEEAKAYTSKIDSIRPLKIKSFQSHLGFLL